MLEFFSGIIGEKENVSLEKFQKQEYLLSLTFPTIDAGQDNWMERQFSQDKCFEGLNILGLHKSLGWDRTTMSFVLHFWKLLAFPICFMVDGLSVDSGISKGLIRLIP